MDELSIIKCDAADELACLLPGQAEPQPCFIELDEHGCVYVAYNPNFGGTTIPLTVFHGRDLRWNIPLIQGDSANELMEQLRPLFQRVHAGRTIEWDGSNLVGRLAEDALRASEEIDTALSNVESDLEIVRAADVMSLASAADFGIDAKTSDEELEAIASRYCEDYDSGVLTIVEGLAKFLRELRDDLQED